MNQKRTLQEQIEQKTRQLRTHESGTIDVDQLKRKAQTDIKQSLKKRVVLVNDHFKKSVEQRKICQAR